MIPLRTFVLPHHASSRICTLSSKILPTYCSLPLSAASLHSLHLLVAVSSMSKIVERVARPCMTLNLVTGAAIGWGGGTMKKRRMVFGEGREFKNGEKNSGEDGKMGKDLGTDKGDIGSINYPQNLRLAQSQTKGRKIGRWLTR